MVFSEDCTVRQKKSTGTAAEKRVKNLHPTEEVLTVECAFCKGKGKDPFNLLSSLAECQVCVGRGVVMVPRTAVKCAFCKATGVYPGKRLTCTTCGGKGRVAATLPFETCQRCKGLGASLHEGLPCLDCKGSGVMKVEAAGGCIHAD
ncbi:MAG: hypothetical protein HY880_00095 [Deltaproteobacteria bacterium]|nr:hypothetical protein [Deltaproteobacteria bacterium]